MSRLGTIAGLLREFRLFIREDKTWWLIPILLVVAFLGTFTIFVQGSALAPLIYAIF